MTASYARGTVSEDLRRAYVRGVIEACATVGATSDATAKVCDELGVMAEDLAELVIEAREEKK